jgi:hypothetical protein
MEPDGNSSIEVVCRVHSFSNQLFGLQLGLKDSVHIEGNNEECFDGSRTRPPLLVRMRQEPGYMLLHQRMAGIGNLQRHWDMADGVGI